MPRRTKELEKLWWDWLSTAERLLRSLYEQTAALTLRDISRIERLQPELDSLMALMHDIDARAVELARYLAEELDCEPHLMALVKSLPKEEGMQLQSVANRVIVVGRNVQNVIAKNRRLIENELETVQGTMAVVAKEAVEQNQKYSASGTRQASVLVNQVA
jgi:membrane protease subunit (stomatin/prohibitin family)